MFLALWNYLHGYVIINVTGFSVERFVNLAAHRGIYIWDVCPQGTGITMKVSIEGFRMLKEASRKTKCHVKIVGRRGLPFTMNRYRKRKILMVGLLFFVMALYALSSFIWVVEIEGNDRITVESLLKSCDEKGLSPGSYKGKIDTKNLSELLIEEFPDISWVSVKIHGTNALISIVETIPETEIVDRTTPCDIVAKKDGIIESVATSAGTPLIKPRDIVQAGQLLVSSEVLMKDGDIEVGKSYVKAQAQVRAKVWYEINEETQIVYEEKVYTDDTKKDLSLIICDKNINFVKPNAKDRSFDKEKLFEKPLSIGDYIFPIAIMEEKYKFYTTVEKTKTVDEAKAELNKVIEDKIKEIIGDSSTLSECNIEFQESGNKLSAKAVIVVIERIDEEKKIVDDGRKIENGTGGENIEH